MARNQTVPVQAEVLEADQNAYLLLKEMRDYKPANPACSVEAMGAKIDALHSTQATVLKAQEALASARDAFCTAGWEAHNCMLDIKVQVAAQYGTSSNQVAALGLKKKSERKTPARAAKPANKPP